MVAARPTLTAASLLSAGGDEGRVAAMSRFVDLSAPIVPSPPDTPDPLRTDIVFQGHEAGAAAIEALLGVGRELLRDGEGWATEEFTRLGTHNTTHVDAPWHYNSTIAGERAQTIDELPLEWFHAPGVVPGLRRTRPTATRSRSPRSTTRSPRSTATSSRSTSS